jgi:hypothetical protein
MPEKAVQQLDLGRFTWGDSEIPDNSFRRRSRMRRLHRFAARIGRRSIDRALPRRGRGGKARKFHALFGVMIDYKPE